MLQWSQIDRSRLGERTQIPLPQEGVGLGYEFEYEGQRWRIVAFGNARDMGFGRSPSERSAYVCAPLGHLRARSH